MRIADYTTADWALQSPYIPLRYRSCTAQLVRENKQTTIVTPDPELFVGKGGDGILTFALPLLKGTRDMMYSFDAEKTRGSLAINALRSVDMQLPHTLYRYAYLQSDPVLMLRIMAGSRPSYDINMGLSDNLYALAVDKKRIFAAAAKASPRIRLENNGSKLTIMDAYRRADIGSISATAEYPTIEERPNEIVSWILGVGRGHLLNSWRRTYYQDAKLAVPQVPRLIFNTFFDTDNVGMLALLGMLQILTYHKQGEEQVVALWEDRLNYWEDGPPPTLDEIKRLCKTIPGIGEATNTFAQVYNLGMPFGTLPELAYQLIYGTNDALMDRIMYLHMQSEIAKKLSDSQVVGWMASKGLALFLEKAEGRTGISKEDIGGIFDWLISTLASYATPRDAVLSQLLNIARWSALPVDADEGAQFEGFERLAHLLTMILRVLNCKS